MAMQNQQQQSVHFSTEILKELLGGSIWDSRDLVRKKQHDFPVTRISQWYGSLGFLTRNGEIVFLQKIPGGPSLLREV